MERKTKCVKVGVVGLGGRSKAWLRNFALNPDCRVTALCDKIKALTEEKRALLADLDKDSNAVGYTDVEKMLKEADIDAVSLVVEPEHNADLICLALAAGKHVITEVPLCFSIKDCWKIVRAVEKAGGLKFQLGEQVRFRPFVQAWKQMVRNGELGKILYAEGQYLHGPGPDRFWHDSRTGARITAEQARHTKAHKSRAWSLIHPIRYMPHELSPLMSILDDRVVKVVGMATRPKSYRYEWYPRSDLEVALMHTEKDTIIRLMAGFTTETLAGSEHRYRMTGVSGWVETGPVGGEDKGLLWLSDGYMRDKAEVSWGFNAPWDAPVEFRKMGLPYSPQAHSSGHGGSDYYPVATFIQSIRRDLPTVMGVYQAAESAAPAILAGESIERGNVPLAVPDFRPKKPIQ